MGYFTDASDEKVHKFIVDSNNGDVRPAFGQTIASGINVILSFSYVVNL